MLKQLWYLLGIVAMPSLLKVALIIMISRKDLKEWEMEEGRMRTHSKNGEWLGRFIG